MEYLHLFLGLIKKWSSYLGLANRQSFEDTFYQLLREKSYDEALKLAQQHDYLDIDLVYKCKWRNSTITVQSINHVLAKIQDKLWTINECVKTIPISYEACRTLLEFGLKEANLKLLYQLGYEDPDIDYPKYGTKRKYKPHLDDDIGEEAIEGLIDFNNLNERQKELCQCRQMLIQHEHSLFTYESILGDYRTIQGHFDHVFYHEFRQRCPLNNCIYYANDADAHAVEILLNFYTNEISAHILPILSNFPETLSPFKYRNLLPCLRDDEDVYIWRNTSGQIKQNKCDWCHRDSSSSIETISREISKDHENEFYKSNEHLKKYLKPLTSELLSQWFVERALEIESRTLLQTSAIQLLSLGSELNIKDLQTIYKDLKEFNEIIYECLSESNLYMNYTEFNELSIVDKLILMTGDSNKACKDKLVTFVIPYMHRRELTKEIKNDSKIQILRDYFNRLAHSREQICRTVYNHLLDQIEEDKFVAKWTEGLDDVIDDIGLEIKNIEQDRQAKLLSNMASQTMALGDYKASYQACQLIMKQNFGKCWTLCCQLGMSKEFTDNQAKYKLLAFALAYCDDADGRMSAKILNHIIELRKRDEEIQLAYLKLNE